MLAIDETETDVGVIADEENTNASNCGSGSSTTVHSPSATTTTMKIQLDNPTKEENEMGGDEDSLAESGHSDKMTIDEGKRNVSILAFNCHRHEFSDAKYLPDIFQKCIKLASNCLHTMHMIRINFVSQT